MGPPSGGPFAFGRPGFGNGLFTLLPQADPTEGYRSV
jgi:hypothetical protein